MEERSKKPRYDVVDLTCPGAIGQPPVAPLTADDLREQCSLDKAGSNCHGARQETKGEEETGESPSFEATSLGDEERSASDEREPTLLEEEEEEEATGL